MFKRGLALTLAAATVTLTFTGCAGNANAFDAAKSITVISREEGSGTRGAFVELLGIEEKDADGKKIDRTAKTADITQSTGVMLTSVAQNSYAIGYVSLGSLNDTVKALNVDGAQATVDNVKSGAYKISRPFHIVTKAEATPAANDFIAYMLSAEGQAIVEASGYISSGNQGAYTSSNATGKVTVAGSSSVTPVMEKLKEAYVKLNPDIQIEVSPSDSSMGIASTVDGICDIGMASREIKDSELEKGVVPQQIAIDGLAVIVNKTNTVADLTQEQICSIYIGETSTWANTTK